MLKKNHVRSVFVGTNEIQIVREKKLKKIKIELYDTK